MPASLLDLDRLVVEEHHKLFEMNQSFDVFDEQGTPVGAVAQTEKSAFHTVVKLFSDLDRYVPKTLEIREADGRPVLKVHKPWFKMQGIVSGPDGSHVGTLQKQLRLGKSRFTMTNATGETLGEVHTRNWRAKDFSVLDANGEEVARVGKQWKGVARAVFTDADTYNVELRPGLSGALRPLVIATALVVDAILHENVN